MDAPPPAADFVAKSFDHDRPVVRHSSSGRRLVIQVREEILGRKVIKARSFVEPFRGRLVVQTTQLADHLAERRAELDWAARSVRLPEGDLARLTRRGGDHYLGLSDLDDPPRGSAKHERLADARLVHHLLVELADPPAIFCEIHRVEAAVWNGASVGDGQPLPPAPPPPLPPTPPPHNP